MPFMHLRLSRPQGTGPALDTAALADRLTAFWGYGGHTQERRWIAPDTPASQTATAAAR